MSDGVRTGRVRYPKPKFIPVGGDTVAVYDGRVIIRVPFEAPAGADRVIAVRGRVKFQACDDDACFAPSEEAFAVNVTVVAGETPTETVTIDTQLPATISQIETQYSQLETPNSQLPTPSYQLLTAFLGGLALNLTPCCYPIIPITVAYFARQVPSRRRRLALAGIYVLSLALVYAVLGTIAAMTGSLFGGFLQSPWVQIGAASLMVVFALGMWGAYDIRLPHALHLIADSRPGPFGAATMGATMGIVAAPCVGPIIAGLLLYVGARGNAAEGFMLFLALGLGLGAPYLFLGAISESIATLPKAGRLMMGVKRYLGVILLGIALWFLLPIIGHAPFRLALGILIGGTGLLTIFWGIGRRAADRLLEPAAFRVARRIFGVLLIFTSTFFFRPQSAVEMNWRPFTHEAFEASKGKPVIIDFTADWCPPCLELDAITFKDPDVAAAAEGFALFKADFTKATPETRALAEKFDIIGVPTVVFIDPTGAERTELRLVGYEPPQKFLRRINALRGRHQ